MNQPQTNLAIIGCGPRGLSALEEFLVRLSKENTTITPQITIFEKAEALGCGYIYRQDQPDTNWLNISERALTIEARPEINVGNLNIVSFPSYHDWTGKTKDLILNNDHEVFPKRSEIGKYLSERYLSFAPQLIDKNWLKVIKQTVYTVEFVEEHFKITTRNNAIYKSDEVLLTIGHQDTYYPAQIKEWITFAEKHNSLKLYTDTYPIAHVLNTNFKTEAHKVGIRGFGLAMIDLVRALCEANGGSFIITNHETHSMRYIKGHTPLQIVPFSLDGLPMASKPLNSKIDAIFTPTNARLLSFESQLKQVSNQANYNQGNQFLIEAMATITAQHYSELKNKAYSHALNVAGLKKVIVSYLKEDNFTHDLILSNNNAPEVIMQSFINMATGSQPISLDYFLGQMWRHCEPTLYKTMSHSNLSDETLKTVVDLDERMKRYAFGPPIESLQQLLALTLEGTLNLNYINNPDISLTAKGWHLIKDQQQVTVNIMVNSVLDSPELLQVSTPLIKNLLKDKVIKPVHTALGVKTKNDGIVVSKYVNNTINLALLGRLAKGSVVGVDAILECFGTRIKDWAEAAVNRYRKRLKTI